MKTSVTSLLYAGLTAAALAANVPNEPLDNANAYTLELSANMQPTANLFPLSILRDPMFDTLIPLGYNFSDGSNHCCYEFREGKPCNYVFKGNRKGLYFSNLWSAHTLRQSRSTAKYGELKTAVKDNGKPYNDHMINYFDAPTRKYLHDCEEFTVKTILERSSGKVYIWGIDNEWECPVDYSIEAKNQFRPWLEKLYKGDIQQLNQAWQTNYRSFAEAEPPAIAECRQRPGAWLDWRRFQEEAYTDLIVERFKTINETDPEHRPVVSKSTQCTIEMTAVAKTRLNNHEMLAAKARKYSHGWYGIDMYGHGDRNCYEFNYLYNCVLPNQPNDHQFRYGIFVAETNNHAGPGWQFAEAFWRDLANGVKGYNFFTLGYFGSKDDWATFGFTNPADGSRYDRFYYAGRLGSMIHRSEAFWAQCIPAALPRVAILVPQRDILLAENSGVSLWDYAKNNRLQVYSRLRDQGYWVDAIPYGKLNPEFISRYQAVFLVDAEHLSADECANLKDYVNKGGVLLADTRAGFFDEHHRPVHGLDQLLGVELGEVYTGIDVSPDDLWYNTPDGNIIRTDGKIKAKMLTARLLNQSDADSNAKAAWVSANAWGKGTVYWFNTRLGVLRPESGDDLTVSAWMVKFLQRSGINPGYRLESGRTNLLRVENPQIDANGNCALVISNTRRPPTAPDRLTITLPAGTYSTALWSPAETTDLSQLSITRQSDGQYQLNIPAVTTAGVIYLFNNHPPLLGIKTIHQGAAVAVDPWTPQLQPGQTVTVKVQAANPGKNTVSGTLSLQAYQDWTVKPKTIQVVDLPVGQMKEYEFQVTVPRTSERFQPHQVYPLVARWSEKDKAVAMENACVTVAFDRTAVSQLLSDNLASYENPRPMLIPTGAEYRYQIPAGNPAQAQIADPGTGKNGEQNGKALTAGLKGWDRQAVFRNLNSIEIIFDLKQRYRISTIKAAAGMPRGPQSFQVMLSDDGKEFKIASAATVWQQNVKEPVWAETDLTDQSARYVKLVLKFDAKTHSGALDEVEIWGKTIPAK